jgi:hypothetical protein
MIVYFGYEEDENLLRFSGGCSNSLFDVLPVSIKLNSKNYAAGCQDEFFGLLCDDIPNLVDPNVALHDDTNVLMISMISMI